MTFINDIHVGLHSHTDINFHNRDSIVVELVFSQLISLRDTNHCERNGKETQVLVSIKSSKFNDILINSAISVSRSDATIVTQDHLEKLAKIFPDAEYTRFCNKLKHEYHEATKILLKHNNDYRKALMEILMAWHTECREGHRSELEKALRDVDQGGLIGQIFE